MAVPDALQVIGTISAKVKVQNPTAVSHDLQLQCKLMLNRKLIQKFAAKKKVHFYAQQITSVTIYIMGSGPLYQNFNRIPLKSTNPMVKDKINAQRIIIERDVIDDAKRVSTDKFTRPVSTFA